MERMVIAAALWLLPVPLCAQWLNLPTPGIPRTADGKPNLTAPAPRTPDGKPDLSGVWQSEVNPYRFDVIQDLKDESIFQPAAEAVFLKNGLDRSENVLLIIHYQDSRFWYRHGKRGCAPAAIGCYSAHSLDARLPF